MEVGMKRIGTLLNFAPGTTADEARKALEEFDAAHPGLLAKDSIAEDWHTRIPFRLETYDDRYGHPVFYIP